MSILVTLAACDGRIDRYSNFVQLAESGWAYGDTIKFMATGNTLTDAATMSVAVRHNEKFLYRNLWLELSYRDSMGNVYVDSVNLELAPMVDGTEVASARLINVLLDYPIQ